VWLQSELNSFKWIYLYTGIGSILTFVAFGYLLGKKQGGIKAEKWSKKKISSGPWIALTD